MKFIQSNTQAKSAIFNKILLKKTMTTKKKKKFISFFVFSVSVKT